MPLKSGAAGSSGGWSTNVAHPHSIQDAVLGRLSSQLRLYMHVTVGKPRSEVKRP